MRRDFNFEQKLLSKILSTIYLSPKSLEYLLYFGSPLVLRNWATSVPRNEANTYMYLIYLYIIYNRKKSRFVMSLDFYIHGRFLRFCDSKGIAEQTY